MKKSRILLIVIVVLVALTGAFVFWASTPYKAEAIALTAMQGSDQVDVVRDEWIVFTPKNQAPTVGFIFYPGGRVEAEAYAPILLAIAKSGYLVVNVPMPLNFAIFGIAKGAQVISAFPQIKHWAIGGHSLGGSMAANYIYNNPETFEGLILWGSYPANNNSLQDRSIGVISIYGSEDGGVESIETSRNVLPETTTWVRIEGGNHAQFGNYGLQKGDGTAAISAEEQQQQTVEATTKFLLSLEK